MSNNPRRAAFAAVIAACLLIFGLPAQAADPAPAFVQQARARGHATTQPVTLANNVTTGNRLIVQVGVWNWGHTTISGVTDSAGNTYTRLAQMIASDGTEQSVWSAPITAGGGTKPTISATAGGAADIGITVLEYAGLSTAAGTGAVDVSAKATGTTSAAGVVSSGPTGATAANNELALGFYADSGFGATLAPGAGFTSRVNFSPDSSMETLAEDQIVAQGTQPAAGVNTGANIPWSVITVVFKTATGSTQPVAPSAPSAVNASPGNASATVSWTAPYDGGSAITRYTITPYIGGTAQQPTVLTGAPPATSTLITGLTNGTGYTFTVTATNAIGTGPASAPSNVVTPAAASQGSWGQLQNWPFVAVHAMALAGGKYLFFDGWHQPEPTYVWDPVANTFTTITAPDSIFCAGNAHLPDGRILAAGGYGKISTGQLGIVDTTIFDSATNTWRRAADMHKARWYPSLTQLSDGKFLVLSGNSVDASTWADTPEVYDPRTDTWTLLSNVNTSAVHEEEYPFTFLAPNGKTFTIGPSEDVSFTLDVTSQAWTPVGASGVTNGSATQYRPGKILYSGGSASINNGTAAQATTAVIDLNSPTPAWRRIAPMNIARTFHTLTTLPDGKVLAIGGAPTANQGAVTTGVLPTEIWDPATETWTTLASMSVARQYHSTALLMPDGKVLSAGGGHPENATGPGQFSAQIYSPPYLSAGTRPVISSAPSTASYGETMSVSTPDAASITAVNLVSLGADTHQSDMSQHFVPLNFTAGNGSLSVQAPASSAIAPPGHYMLFAVNSAGVPSVAAQVRILAPSTPPSAPSGVNAVPGNGSATVTWSAPTDGGSPITGYTITPYIGSTAQPAILVSGSATSAQINGLTNGTAYTFTVAATNAVGTGPASAPSNVVTPTTTPVPAYVQSAAVRSGGSASRSLALPSSIIAGDRIIVQVGVWNWGRPTASSVTDSAGNVYTRLSTVVASDGTEQSVWSAPITAGGGTKPTITATATGSADIAVAAVEYSGLSTAAGAGAVDVSAKATGTTSAAGVVSSGPTAATTAGGELALGFYLDSGFGASLTAGSGYTARVNVSPTSDMEFVVEDSVVSQGVTANAGVRTGSGVPWSMITVVFRHG